MKLDRSSSSRTAILVFLLSSLSTVGITWQLEQQRLRNERDRVANIADDYANSIQRKIKGTLSVTYAIAALVNQYQGMIPNFQKVAGDLLPLYPGAYALAMLPNGVVREIAILEGKEKVINYNRLKDLNRFRKNLVDKNQTKTNIDVPFHLIENFAGAIGYLPITLTTSQGNRTFWGLTTVTISFPELLEDIHLEQLEKQGFAYQLRGTDPITNQTRIFATSSTAIRENPLEETFHIDRVNWTLSLTPISGWTQIIRLSLKFLLSLFFSFMLAALVRLFLDSKVHAFELEKVAYFDSLTGLPNRRLLVYRLSQIIPQTKRSNKNVAICYLDLDNFHVINDHLGSKAGDYLLVRVAKRLQKFLRIEDTIARISGDEFAIVLQDLSCVEEVELILQRIIEAVTTSMVLDSEVISVFTSIGVTMYPQDDSNIDTLLRHAEQAMSYSKQNNKGSYTLFFNLDRTSVQSSSNQF